MKNNDAEFAGAIKNLISFLAQATDEDEKKQLYDRAMELINARFGTCPRCGFVNTGGKFCSECGQELAGEVVEEKEEPLSVEYLITTSHNNSKQILALFEDEAVARTNLQKYLARGMSVIICKRTVELLR